MKNRALVIDGKVVRSWLIACVRKNVDGTSHPHLFQVDAFDKDHAILRLCLARPEVPKNAWTIIEELDAEHDIGRMGSYLPLEVAGTTRAPGSRSLN